MKDLTSYYFKGFRGVDEEVILPALSKINIIIGPNNSGKSTILDALAFFTRQGLDVFTPWQNYAWYNASPYHMGFYKQLTEEDQNILGQMMSSMEQKNGSIKIAQVDGSTYQLRSPSKLDSSDVGLQNTLKSLSHPLKDKIWLRLRSDRNLVPDNESFDKKHQLMEDGYAATSALNTLIRNGAYRDYPKVIDQIITALNLIYRDVAIFEAITVQETTNSKREKIHEIFLREKGRDFVLPISEIGSGARTIILILLYLYVYPYLSEKKLDNLVLAIEEPENNLHPQLEKNLYSFLEATVKKHPNLRLFITSHSNIALNFFFGLENAGIWKLERNDGHLMVEEVTTRHHNYQVMESLGVLPADILQANGIIWVEGPTDRIYVNRFIDILSDGRLREGVHYQCVFYGGSLLANYSAQPTADSKDVNILNVNRNSAIIMDRDRKSDLEPLKARVQKMLVDVAASEQYIFNWVTEGVEIENYLPKEALAQAYDVDVPKNSCGKDEKINTYLDSICDGLGMKYIADKKTAALLITEYITKENIIKGGTDLVDRTTQLIATIKSWNHID